MDSYAELAKLIGNYGVGIVCLAVLISLHIYNVRVTLPTLAKAAREDLANLLNTFKEEQAKERASTEAIIQSLASSFKEVSDNDRKSSATTIEILNRTFREELKEERLQCREDHEKLMAAVQGNKNQLITLTERQDILLHSKQGREKRET